MRITLIEEALAPSFVIVGFLEEQLLQGQPTNFPIGVQRFAHDKPALTSGVERGERDDVYVDVFALNVDAASASREADRGGHPGAGRPRPHMTGHLEVSLVLVELEPQSVVTLEQPVSMLDVFTNGDAQPL